MEGSFWETRGFPIISIRETARELVGIKQNAGVKSEWRPGMLRLGGELCLGNTLGMRRERGGESPGACEKPRAFSDYCS